ncbi:MAG: InlB B-repeat-containing protein, partial [Oscillospiraceae bacterium]|nr:InlB B-repeat-containing protein [Oscillospiraceae bacterium]
HSYISGDNGLFTQMTVPADGWLAVKIYVPEDGVYEISGTAYLSATSCTKQEMYILPAEAKFDYTNEATYGSVEYNSTTELYERKNAPSFTQLQIPNSAYVGWSNLYDKSETAMPLDSSNYKRMKLSEGDYIVILRNATEATDKRLALATLTLTPSDEPYYAEQTYTFNTSVLTNGVSGLVYDYDTTNKKATSKISDFACVDSVSAAWCITTLGGTHASYKNRQNSTINSSNLVIHNNWAHINGSGADARFVMKIDVDESGKYDISTALTESAYGSRADVYIIPVTSELTEIDAATIKNSERIGSICNYTGLKDEYVGKASLTAGENYLVFVPCGEHPGANVRNASQQLNISSLTIKEASAEESVDTYSKTAQFAFGTTEGGSVTASDADGGITGTKSVALGTSITLTATPDEGYDFVCWVRGADKDDTSKYLSKESPYTYKVYTNTYVTAVFEPEAAGDVEEKICFWNENGVKIDEKTVSDYQEGGIEEPSLTGYTFAGWYVDEETTLASAIEAGELPAITNAVAKYTPNAAADNTAGWGYAWLNVNGDYSKYSSSTCAIPFNEPIVCTDNGGTVTHWLRDGHIVSYDAEYTHYMWDTTNIYSSYYDIEKKPVVVLDTATVDGARMIEYAAPTGYEIVEVGILFGASGSTPTVSSAHDKAVSQRGVSHGQFTAQPSDEQYSAARGYMIYKHGGNAYVIYSE